MKKWSKMAQNSLKCLLNTLFSTKKKVWNGFEPPPLYGNFPTFFNPSLIVHLVQTKQPLLVHGLVKNPSVLGEETMFKDSVGKRGFLT